MSSTDQYLASREFAQSVQSHERRIANEFRDTIDHARPNDLDV